MTATTALRAGTRHRADRALALALLASALLHGAGLFVVYRWGACLCHLGQVVCPKICCQSEARIDLQLAKAPPPPAQPPLAPKPKPTVVAPKDPPAAPKRGRVVLPDEALRPQPQPRTDITAKLPSLPKEVVVSQSQAQAPVLATPEIFDRAQELTPGPPGEYGLGGTGRATGAGPVGPSPRSTQSGERPAAAPPAPRAEPSPALPPPPAPKPKGPSRPPQVLNWTDPPYPEQARQQGVEGTVLVRVRVSASGQVEQAAVARSSGHAALDEAAVAHVKRARFSPALKEGEPVAATVAFRVRFRLVGA